MQSCMFCAFILQEVFEKMSPAWISILQSSSKISSMNSKDRQGGRKLSLLGEYLPLLFNDNNFDFYHSPTTSTYKLLHIFEKRRQLLFAYSLF